MANLGNDLILVTPGTVVTATGVGTGVEVDDRGEYRGRVLVTAVSGTSPTLVVNYQTSYDNGATDAWRTLASSASISTVSTSPDVSVPGLDRWIRATWTVGGTTPSFTFGTYGEAV